MPLRHISSLLARLLFVLWCMLGLRYHRDARGGMRCHLVVLRRCRWFWRTWRLGFGGGREGFCRVWDSRVRMYGFECGSGVLLLAYVFIYFSVVELS